MKKTGLADSPLFSMPQKVKGATPSLDKPLAEETGKKGPVNTESNQATKQSSNRGTMTPPDHDTTVSRYHDAIIELVRKAVKEFGKEAATHRFTLEEKKAIAEIIYTFKKRGIKTNENEVTRIAVNFIIQDYRENRGNSILEKALKALND